MTDVIFGNPKVKFGNVWAFTSRMILHGQRSDLSKVLLSSKSKRIPWILEMWKEFDTQGLEVEIVDKPYTTLKKYGTPEHKEPYVPTRTKWHPLRNNQRHMCYQLEPGKHIRHKDKLYTGSIQNLFSIVTPEDVQWRVGLPKSLTESIGIMSQCELFIGICSGMSHIAHSVGLPVYLKDWRYLKRSHPDKDYFAFDENNPDSMKEMIDDINKRRSL